MNPAPVSSRAPPSGSAPSCTSNPGTTPALPCKALSGPTEAGCSAGAADCVADGVGVADGSGFWVGAASASCRARSCVSCTVMPSRRCTLRHQSAVLANATASAAAAITQAHGAGLRAGLSGSGRGASRHRARNSAVMRAVCVSMVASSARRSSANSSRSALSVSGLTGGAAGAEVAASGGALAATKVDCSGPRRSGTRCS